MNNKSINNLSNEIALAAKCSLSEIPITALSQSALRLLAASLNSTKIFRSDAGYERDWRGIAALALLKGHYDARALSGGDAFERVLQLWCSNNLKTATLAHLVRFLGIIDRCDVLDDIDVFLVEATENYNAQLPQKKLALNDVGAAAANDTSGDNYANGADTNILTTDDVMCAQKGLPPQKYDAFVLFADADYRYANELLAKLEHNAPNDFKLCLKDRDLLAGVSFSHVALTQLIEQRCKHLIVILTSAFMKSPENQFLLNYTQALQIEHKTRKIIPLLYEDSLIVPRTLKIYTHLKYNTQSNRLVDFWGRLAASIGSANVTKEMKPVIGTAKICSFSASSGLKKTLKPVLCMLPTPPIDAHSLNINGHGFVPEDGGASYLHDSKEFGFSEVSTTPMKKKKNKFPSKLFRKIFSRSNAKQQQLA